ncbi:MAG: thioredoxin family protein [Candidatus Aminicenantaceae bacterium]
MKKFSKRKGWIILVLFVFSSIVLSELKKPEKMDEETIRSSLPGFQEKFQNYHPNDRHIEQLHSLNDFIRIEVFFSLECSDSVDYVPVFMKILEKADNPYIEAEYFVIPKDKSQRETYSHQKNITKIPTFILFIDNQEKGRIVEKPATSLEQDLADILSTPPPPDYGVDYDFFMYNYHGDLDFNDPVCLECHLPD